MTERAGRVVIKIGGAALAPERGAASLTAIAPYVRELQSEGHAVAIVHGGGPSINAELARRQIEWTFIDGNRVTTPEMIDAIDWVLSSLVNRRITSALGSSGLRTIGLSGANARIFVCRPARAELGRVGEITSVDARAVTALSDAGVLPVISPIGADADGLAYNINADWAASHFAAGWKADRLVFFTDQAGVWDQNREPLRHCTVGDLASLVEAGTVQGGMLTKVRATLYAIDQGIKQVRIADGMQPTKGTEIG